MGKRNYRCLSSSTDTFFEFSLCSIYEKYLSKNCAYIWWIWNLISYLLLMIRLLITTKNIYYFDNRLHIVHNKISKMNRLNLWFLDIWKLVCSSCIGRRILCGITSSKFCSNILSFIFLDPLYLFRRDNRFLERCQYILSFGLTCPSLNTNPQSSSLISTHSLSFCSKFEFWRQGFSLSNIFDVLGHTVIVNVFARFVVRSTSQSLPTTSSKDPMT